MFVDTEQPEPVGIRLSAGRSSGPQKPLRSLSVGSPTLERPQWLVWASRPQAPLPADARESLDL
jgi:hypothetical protein